MSSQTLTIYTDYPDTVTDRLLKEQLVEKHDFLKPGDTYIQIKLPYDEGIGQCLKYWLDGVKVFGIIDEYSFNRQSGGRP